jgi:hypothetical protein
MAAKRVALIAGALVALRMGIPSAEEPVRLEQVDLNRPEALEKLRASRPAHYERVQGILGGLDRHGSLGVPDSITAKYEASSVRYSSLMLTSDPPQRDLSFVLDDTRYRARVRLAPGGAQIVPVR